MPQTLFQKLSATGLIWLALFFALMAGKLAHRAELQRQASFFSEESLQSLQELNNAHAMVLGDLDSSREDSPLSADLFLANSFDTVGSEDHKGLIVSTDSDELLILQPQKALSDLQLQSIADEYEASIPEFEHVELDQNVELFGRPHYWKAALPKIPVQLSEEPIVTPLVIAVIDSGMDLEHEAFEGRTLLDGWNTFSEDGTGMSDEVGHGTHIAGIIAEAVPGASIAPYKIVDAEGGRLSNVLMALDKAIEDEVDLINMSFGLLSPSESLAYLIDEAYENGIVMVSAAGNHNTDRPFYPASYNETVSVASVDDFNEGLSSSNYGDWIDVAANGHTILSAVPGNEYAYKTGTSQATASVTAALAQVMNEAGLEYTLSFEELMRRLTEEALLVEEGKLAGVPIVE